MARPASLVTGAAGFIGSHLTDRLLKAGDRVIGIDNLALGRKSNLAAAGRRPGFRLIIADLNDARRCLASLRGALAAMKIGRIHTIWHLAANSDIQAGGADPALDLRNTFMTTFQVLALARTLKVPELVFASSSAIYGEHPARLHEGTGPLCPVSYYGAMKLASEGVISAALQGSLRRAWILRFPNVVGSRGTHGVIHDFIHKLRRDPSRLEVLGDGTQSKPYLHVRELIDAMLFCHNHSRQRLNCFNIGVLNTATTVRAIAELVVREVAPAAKIRYTGGNRGWIGDVPRFRYSTKKINALGWRPRLTSSQAVALAVRELRAEIAS